MSQPPERFAVAVAQPRLDPSEVEEGKVAVAADMLAEAADQGARLVLFPEGFPGPLRRTSDFDAAPRMAAIGARHGCAVCWSRIEPDESGAWRLVAYIHDHTGEQVLRYERAHPATGDVHQVLSGVSLAPGESFAVAEIGGVRVGVMVCSELWLPEVARVLAIRGAELLLAPAGGGFHRVAPNWKLMAQARAIEDECHLALTQHLIAGESGAAMIAGPEGVLGEREDEGVLVCELDLARARWLRSIDDSMQEPKPFSSLPGLLRARRPELYGELAAPAEGLYDYRGAADAATGG